MDPVAFLLDDVPVELVGSEKGALPPGVACTSNPGPNSQHSNPAEVLVELGLVDLADTEATHRDELSADSSRDEEEDRGDGPDSERAEEGEGFEVALQEVVEVSGHAQSADMRMRT